jgi:hypothetical protein
VHHRVRRCCAVDSPSIVPARISKLGLVGTTERELA